MPKYLKHILILVCLVIILILPYFVFANDALNKLKSVGAGDNGSGPYASYSGGDDYAFSYILGIIINAALGLLGVIFIILMLYAGYNWMTASGDEDKVTKAKDTIWRAIIGIIITVGAYAIWNFIYEKLITK